MMGAGYYYEETPQQAFYRRCVGWEYKFVLWPRECLITGKKLWLEYAYRGCSVLTGPGDAIIEYRWHHKHEHLIWKLKK
jgi:hypothetical protein